MQMEKIDIWYGKGCLILSFVLGKKCFLIGESILKSIILYKLKKFKLIWTDRFLFIGFILHIFI